MQGLSNILFPIDENEGIAELALEAGSSAIDSDVLCIDCVVLVLLRFRIIAIR